MSHPPDRPVRLIAAVSAYDERELLPGCIDSLRVADRIVVVDGVFADYPHEAPASTDGMLEWLAEAAQADPRIEVVTHQGPWASEVEKRSAYLVGAPGDWYLVIDADERLYDGETLKALLAHSSVDSWAMPFFDRPGDPAPIPAGRVFRHIDGIRYEVGDGRVVAAGKVLVNADRGEHTVRWREGYPGPRILHMQHRRSAARQRMREEYIRRVVDRDPLLKEQVRRSGLDPIEAFRRRQRGQSGVLESPGRDVAQSG